MTDLQTLRTQIRAHHLRDETQLTDELVRAAGLSDGQQQRITGTAIGLINSIRNDATPGLMEVFLAEYGLSTEEGVALMCLAEALLRVPDAETIDALIEDKIAPSQWGKHLGHSSSSLVNASTWALMLTGKVLKDDQPGIAGVLRGALKRLGEPVIRAAVGRAMQEMGAQFVLGQTIDEALRRRAKAVAKGYTYSFDMLGEAAMTQVDADAFYDAYAEAIDRLADEVPGRDIRETPGISIKLSALHPRYDVSQTPRVMSELVARTLQLARMAKAAGMGLNIDAEEANRLDLSLDVIEAVLRDPSLRGWDGFGVVVQAYGRRAGPVIDWLHALAGELDTRLMVRLVKGAYWDTEIKRAQVEGLADFPVFTRKAATDVSYIACARKLLGYRDRIYPQFATHNAQTVAAVLELAGEDRTSYEFQRLHGMGEALHQIVRDRHGTRCRIYAPVGSHRDLLAYLVRRLLENGANSSFVNQIVDESVPAETVAADPFAALAPGLGNGAVQAPAALYGAERVNSRGWDLDAVTDLAEIETARAPFVAHRWAAGPITAHAPEPGEVITVTNPADPADTVGHVALSSPGDIEQALAAAQTWTASPETRKAVLWRAADLYEQRFGEAFALLIREAGKTPRDAIAELREAVDFLRYYGARAPELSQPARGVFTCISPWNFPLAIFTGQIAAALAAGNGVLAKPAETTNLVAAFAVGLLQDAGVPAQVLQLLPGPGSVVGAALSSDARVAGICFTGSTATAQRINRSMAQTLAPSAPLIAETGGLNAMIVDSTALPEQAIRDVIASAFQSAGQRCSALRCLYVQEDVAETYLHMLTGAMDELTLGAPWHMSTDVGPVINEAARTAIEDYIDAARAEGRVIHELARPNAGSFVAPTLLRVPGIEALDREVFGPVLHFATFTASELDTVVERINASGFGLTFGMHSRIDDRIQQVTGQLKVGNIYINRNQIGAIVGSQPFGGEGLSGTGPKAGGPDYVARFTRADLVSQDSGIGRKVSPLEAQTLLDGAPRPERAALHTTVLPGPTGESNILTRYGRGVILCLGPSAEMADAQAEIATANGCTAVRIACGATGAQALDGQLDPSDLASLTGFDAVAFWGSAEQQRQARLTLARRDGALLPLFTERDFAARCHLERHICIDTTAAGGNASLLAEAG